MSYRFEFPARVHEGRIELPAEIASRLALRGIERVRIVLTSGHEEELLADRGIDTPVVDRVASAQSIDRDVATVVLAGEGSAAGTPLESRLNHLAGIGT